MLRALTLVGRGATVTVSVRLFTAAAVGVAVTSCQLAEPVLGEGDVVDEVACGEAGAGFAPLGEEPGECGSRGAAFADPQTYPGSPSRPDLYAEDHGFLAPGHWRCHGR